MPRWCLLAPNFLLCNPCPLKKLKPSYCNTMLATCIIAGLLIAGIPQSSKGLKLQATVVWSYRQVISNSAGRLSSAARQLYERTEMLCNLHGEVGGCQIILCLHVVCWGRQNCSFGSLVLWTSRRLICCTDLNCRVDKQPVVGNLFFVGLWIAGNSHRSEQIMRQLHNKATNPKSTNFISAVLSTFQSLIFSNCGENANSYLAEWPTH